MVVKGTVAQQKTMNGEAGVQIETHNLAPRVDSIRDGKKGSRDVDLCEVRWLPRVVSCFDRR